MQRFSNGGVGVLLMMGLLSPQGKIYPECDTLQHCMEVVALRDQKTSFHPASSSQSFF